MAIQRRKWHKEKQAEIITEEEEELLWVKGVLGDTDE